MKGFFQYISLFCLFLVVGCGSSAIDFDEANRFANSNSGGSESDTDVVNGDPIAIVHVASGGSDELDCGAEASPCGTITYGLTRVEDGGSVLVHAGTYAESDIQMREGVTLDSADGDLQAKIYAFDKSAVRFEGIQNATMSGFEIYGDWSQGSPVDGLVVIKNQGDTGSGGITVKDSMVYNAPCDADLIHVNGIANSVLLENLIAFNPGKRADAGICEVGAAPSSSFYQENIDIQGDRDIDGSSSMKDVVVRGSWLFHEPSKGGDWLILSHVNAEKVMYEGNLFGPSSGDGFGNSNVGIGSSLRRSPDTGDHSVKEAIVRNNIFVDLKGDGALSVVNANDAWIYNNVFYQNGSSLGALMEIRGNYVDPVDVSVFNNIFKDNSPYRALYWARELTSGAPTNFFHGYNVYDGTTLGITSAYNVSGNEVMSLSVDPLMIAPVVPSIATLPTSLSEIGTHTAKFHISSSSTVKNVGLDAVGRAGHPSWSSSSMTRHDVDGQSRPIGDTWDIGIYEVDPS